MAALNPRVIPPLDWLRSFEAAARLANFTGAASELGITQAAVSQHIRLLEERLQSKLFTRLARGVALTPEGAAYLPHIQFAFAAIGNSTLELFRRRPTENVVLRTPVSFAVLMLAPRLAALSAALPFLTLQLETIHKPADYGDDWLGLDVRFGDGNFPGRQSTRLTTETLQPMASPRLAAADDWRRLPRLSVVGPRQLWGDWFAAAGMAPEPAPTHKADTFVAALEAARQGAGVLLGSRPLVDASLRDGVLVTLSDFVLGSDAGHHLTAPTGGGLSYAEDALRQWLVTQFQAQRAGGAP
ncbi:MAG: LysR family transcriptional regulator [Rhizobiaceae bacterium]|nr:LysR family transcriptional regulator [Rhizobiaceae bacterium]